VTDRDAQNRLTGAIYDAAIAPSEWPQTLSAIREALSGDVSILYSRDSALTMRHFEVSAVSGWTENDVQRYHAYYGSICTRTPVVTALPAGQVYVDDRQLAFKTVTDSEIFTDFFRPLGIGHCMGATLFKAECRNGLMSVHRALESGPFPLESVALYEYLAPHIVRALQLHRQMQRAEALAGGLALTLDHFPLAVMLVTAEGKVRHMNCRAADLLRDEHFPLRVKADQIFIENGRASDEIRRQIARAVALAQGQARPPCEIIKVRFLDGLSTLSAMVTPLRYHGLPGFEAEPLAAIFLSTPSLPVPLDPQLLMQQFALTPAEASLAVALTQGSNLSEISDARQVSIETARTLLKRILAKTESRSQGQLIVRLSRSLALLRRSEKH
jgi:DNA-binding CsgD family transcriptional regulator